MKDQSATHSNAERGFTFGWSVGAKLTIIFLTLAIVPMSVTAYYNLTHAEDHLINATRDNLVVVSDGIAGRIAQMLTDNLRTSAALAGEATVARFLLASEQERKAMRAEVYQTLQNFADTHPDYDAPGVLDANGIVIASLADILVGKDRSFRDYFQASIHGEAYVSDILVGRGTKRPGVFVTNPVVTAKNKVVGIVIVWLKGAAITSIIEEVAVGQEGIAYLVDQDGVVVAHRNYELLYHSLAELMPAAVATISETIRFGTVEGTDTPLIPSSLGMDDLAHAVMSAKGSGARRYYSPLDQL